MHEQVSGHMDVLILCGGLGTRLRPVVEDRPKSMALIGGRPFLEWQLSLLVSLGFKRVVLCIGYQGDVIREYFLDGSRFGLDILYSEETELLGTGGAIRWAVPCIQSDPVLILNGDSWCEVEIQRLVDWHDVKRANGTLVLTQVSDTRRFGRVEVNDEGTIILMQEKENVSGGGWINAGIYVLSRQFIEAIPKTGLYHLNETCSRLG